jgi:hypothetical protein
VTRDLRGPDFFLVGAPKCGTTAMADYLSQHPAVGMCERKETHFFAGDEMWRRFGLTSGERPLSRDEYLGLFRSVQDRPRLGEASVWYLYAPEAPGEIKKAAPDADIIVMLRNPVEMLPSLHSQFVFVGLEPEESFSRALRLDDEREANGTPRGFPPDSYRSAVRYSEQIRRYIEVFGAEKVHVVTYDDFRSDTQRAFSGACKFLGVDSEFVPDLRVVNPNKRVKSRALRRLVRTPPRPARRLIHAVSTQNVRRRAGRALIRWNTRFGARDPIQENLAPMLRPMVEREVDGLRALLGLDVSVWLDTALRQRPE